MSNSLSLLNNTNDVAMYTNHAHPTKTTEKYRHVNTSDVVSEFQSRGWTTGKYSQSRSVKYSGYQTHSITLVPPSGSSILKVGDSEIRALVVNDHKGGRSLQIKMGLFRLVCSNGLVVSNGDMFSVAIRHVGDSIPEKIQEFIDKITIAAEILRNDLSVFNKTIWSEDTARLFARKALVYRMGEKAVVTDEHVTEVLRPRRLEDMGMDAWSVFNRVQENIVRGFGGSNIRTLRRITSTARDIEINEQLWGLLKAA